jgi:bacteriocin-like protein
MTNNQINPNQEPNENQLSDEELEQIAGGIFGDIVDSVKDKVNDAKDYVKDKVNDINPYDYYK